MGHMLCEWNFPHPYWSRERGKFPYQAVTGQTGIPQQKGPGNISSRMLCLSEARFLFWALRNTRPSVPLITFSFATSMFTYYFLPTFHRCIPAVLCDLGQPDRVLRFDTTVRCGLSRWEREGGVGEGAGGSEEAGPQTHRDGKTETVHGYRRWCYLKKWNKNLFMFLHRTRSCSSSMKSVQEVVSFCLKEPTSTTHSQTSLRCIICLSLYLNPLELHHHNLVTPVESITDKKLYEYSAGTMWVETKGRG